MWSSVFKRRAHLNIHPGVPKLHSVQNPRSNPPQVPQNRTLLPTHLFSPKKKVPFLQNPRFFSQDSRDPLNDDLIRPQNGSPNPQTDENFDGLVHAEDRIFEENPVSVTSELDFEFSSSFGSPFSQSDESFDGLTHKEDSALEENPVSSKSELDSELSSSLAFDEITPGEPLMEGFDDKLVEEEEIAELDLEKLESVLSLLQSRSGRSADGSLESILDEMDLMVNEEFVVRVAETPLVPGENLIAFFKWASKKPKFSVSTRSVRALVGAISSVLKKKDAYVLWDLINEIGEKENGVLNAEILNELISLFSKLGKAKAGFDVFNKFGGFGCVADAETYYFTIEGLCRRSFFDWACSVCDNMVSAGELPESKKVGKIISFLCKGSKAQSAHSVYLLAKKRSIYPPRSSVNFLIISLCQGDETVRLALDMLGDFSVEERKYSIKPYSSVIGGLCRIKNVEGAKNLLLKMIDAGPPPGNAVFNSVINGFSKTGDVEEAKNMMKLMETRGLKPDVYTYSVIMSGYVKGGEMDKACKVLAEAKKRHSKLSPVTYHTLIRGYCKLEEYDKALELFREMKEYGVQPNANECNQMIQSLCLKALDWEKAEKLLEEMTESGLHLNATTKCLVRAVKEMEEEEIGTGEVVEAA